MSKTALITGITGQDASYLAEFLLTQGYCVHGTIRRASTDNLIRVRHILDKITIHYADLTDRRSLHKVLWSVQPDEVYNLAAQSYVGASFEIPDYTRATIVDGTRAILESCRTMNRGIRIYQASSSEMFGTAPPPQNEETSFQPVSPYAEAKVDAFLECRFHRLKYGVHVSNGVLFNHESPRRGQEFVTRKITRALGRMACGLQERCTLGNLDSKRDWGFAGDYVEAMWLMLQQDTPDDYVIATGQMHSVAEFLDAACESLVRQVPSLPNYRDRFDVDRSLFRPREVPALCGDASKARKVLNWQPRTSFQELVDMMVRSDYRLAFAEMAQAEVLEAAQ